MLDRLIDFLLGFWDKLVPCYIINEYQEGVVLRFGHFNKVVEKGFYWKIPFIDEIIEQHVMVTTLNIPPQSIITLDEHSLVIESVVKYRISDTKKYILEVFDAEDAIRDITQSTIKRVIAEKSWDDCRGNDLDDLITKRTRAEIRKFGISIEQVTLTSMDKIRSFRLIGDTRSD